MPASFEELIVERGRAEVGGGAAPGSNRVFRISRRFKVPGETNAAAAVNPDLLTAAGAGVPHPSLPGLISLGPTIGERGGAGDDTFFYAEAEYAVEGTPTFEFPAPDRQNLGFQTIGIAPFEKTIDFPLYVERAIASPTGGSSTEWVKIENKTIIAKCFALTVEWNTDILSASDIGAIYTQMNKLHTFWGGVWVFKPQSADKIFRDGVWNVVFRWESDPGTTAEDLADIEAEPSYCEVAPRAPHALWFEMFDVVYGDVVNAPRLTSRVMYQSAPTGYQSLPGYGTRWSL